MFWNLFFKRRSKRKKTERGTSSSKWRELYSSNLFPLFQNSNKLSNISKMYSLLFFLSEEKNYRDAVHYIENREYGKLSRMNERVPLDYDECFYEMYDIIYINAGENYLAIVKNNENNQELSLEFVTKIESIDLERFLGRRLIYPV